MSDNDHNQSRLNRDPNLADAVRETWREMLPIGPDEQPDFAKAGGSSMDALDMQLKLYKQTSRKLLLESIPEPLTFERIVAALQESEPIADVSSSREINTLEAPATSTQIAQWIIETSNPGSCAYSVPILVRFSEHVEPTRLMLALAQLVQAHPALRTSISRNEIDDVLANNFTQIAHPPVRVFPLESRSVVSLDDEEIRAVLRESLRIPPSIVHTSPFRAIALHVGDEVRGLLMVAHHAAVDDWSIRVIVEDLLSGLRDESIPAEKALLIDFKEKTVDGKDLAWWGETLENLPLNVSFPFTGESLSEWPVLHREFDTSVVQDLDHRCASIGVEPATAIIHAVGRAVASVVDESLSRISVGVPMSIRSDPRLDRTVGMLLNTVPVPVALDDVDLTEALRTTRRTLREARRHKAVPFDRLVHEFGPRRIDSRTPWLDVMVGVVDRPAVEDELCKSQVLPPGESAAPVLVIARRTADRGIRFELQYDPAVVGHEVAVRIANVMIDELESIITGNSKSVDPSVLVGDEAPVAETLVDVVERASSECPNAIAIESDGRSLSFEQLRESGHRIAGSLLEHQVSVGDVVAIDLEPGLEFPLAVFGVLRAGCIAMPLAPDLPDARRAQLLEAGKASVVLNKKLLEVALKSASNAKLPEPTLDSGCYLLFTSGSTGQPKGVQMQHGPIANLVAFESRRSCHAKRTAMLAPLGFDVVFQEIFSTWASGGTLVPAPQSTRRDPFALADFLAENQITRIHISPVLLRALAHATDSIGKALPNLQEVISAGEALKVGHSLRNMAHSAGGFALVNQYGPTETHVATSIDLGSAPEQWSDLPSIGRPIDGVSIRVVDSNGTIVAKGFPGELELGGRAPANGYLGEDLEDRFVSEKGERWYRTGDRVRLTASGDIEFLGREDDQVKIAGSRVEIGEIEHALARLDGVEDVVVVADDEKEDTTLHAFVVPRGTESVDPKSLEKSIRMTLPAFMVPQTIVMCESLPLSPNGKVNRRHLLATIPQDSSVAAISETEDEHRISSIVSSLTRLPSPPHDCTLAQLGLDSLGSIQLQLELERRFGIRVAVQEVLRSSIADLDAIIDNTIAEPGKDPIDNQLLTKDDVGIRELNPLEVDLLAEVAAAPDGAFHLVWKIQFDDIIKPEVLREAIDCLRSKYASLRTAQSVSEGVQLLASEQLPPPRLEILKKIPRPETRMALLRHTLDIEFGECMRVITWPQGQMTVVYLVIHHAAIDGRGADGVISQFISDVHALQHGEKILETSVSGAQTDFVENEEDVSWWVEQTRKVMGDELPRISRRFSNDGEAQWIRAKDSGQLVDKARSCTQQAAIPPAAPIIAAWAIMVSRLVERDRVLIGVPFAVDTGNAGSMGLGTSGLPIAVDASEDRAVSEVVSDVAQLLVTGLDRRHASLGSIARAFTGSKVLSRPPLDAVFSIDSGKQSINGAHVSWEPIGISPFQAALLLESSQDGHDLVTQIESGLLDGEEVDSFSDRFYALLEAVIASLNEDTGESLRIADLPRLTLRQEVRLDAFENGGKCSNQSSSIPDRFLESVSKYPDSTAIITQDEEIDYRTLEQWSATLAEELIQAGIQSGDRVAFFAQRCAESIVTMLGICRSGAVFVPIDPSAPYQRRQQQVEIAEVKAVVAIRPDVREEIPKVDRIIDLPDRARKVSNPSAVKEREASTGLDSGIYVMFTSGTSGDPKGSLVLHRGVLRMASGQPFIRTEGPLRMINAAPLAFDASTLEVWCPLLTGGLISCWEGRSADLVGIAERVNRDKVNAAWLTSALFQAAVDGVPTFFESIQIVNTGGDVVSAEHVRRIQDRYTGLVVVNGYGPTENTVCTTAEVIGPGSLQGKESVLIGRPIFGTSVRILDQVGRRVPIGKAGELVAGGEGVAQGYVGVSNDDRFFVEDGKRYYRTGDLARWTSDGRLEFHGRRDGQVKIAGNRVEFGAIEAALRMCPGVADACVSSIGEGARRKLIAAIAGDDSSISIAAVRNSLENRVSAAEVPSTIVAVPVIPVTSNGKPDRRAVVELVEAVPETQGDVKGDDELIEIVMNVINEIIGHAPSTSTQTLMDAGIDSLDMVRITLALGDRLARPVELGDVIQGGDVAGIATRIRSEISREAENIVTLRGSTEDDRPAAYCIPGVGGTVFSFGSLLDAIDSDIPVLGLPYPGLSGGEQPLDSVDALAERFANLIVHDRPAQVIVGYSLGGFIAFETARRVHELTGVAPSVMVIDAAPALLPSWRALRDRKALRTQLRIRLEAVLPPGVVELLRGRRKRATLASLRGVVAAGFRAVRTYNPELAALDVLLLRMSESKFGGAEGIEDLGWSGITAKIRVKQIEGRHLEVFRGSTGMDVGMAITEEYNRAGRLEIQRRQSFRSSRG